MASFLDIVGTFLFIGLFIFAGLAFIVGLQADNNAVQPIVNHDDTFNRSFSAIGADLEALQGTSQTQYEQFTGEAPKTGFGSIVLFGIVSVGKTFGTTTWNTFYLIIRLPLIVIGVPPSLVSMLITWLSISLIIAAWILYKLGG